MDKVEVCQTILNDLGSVDTKVLTVEGLKGNYYSYITNTIYLNKNNVEDTPDKAKELVILCHESIHSTQKKSLHILNFVLSNIEIFMFIFAIILYLYCGNITKFTIYYTIANILSIAFRIFLEIPAMLKSFEIAKKYSTVEEKEIILENQRKVSRFLPLGILFFSWSRVARLIIVLII